jgi:DNA-binding response OmpR family regulator
MRLLMIEDDPTTASFVRQGLGEIGYSVNVASTAREGEKLALEERHDLILLDVMLPDQSGVELCAELRRRGVRVPILMLTALSTTRHKVTGLDAGADDYLLKPFEFEELVARIKALLRRGAASESSTLEYADLKMDLTRREVTRAGRPIRLTAKEFALLECFLRNKERVLTRTVLGESVWNMRFEHGSNVIDVYLSALRRKIDKEFPTPLLHTIIGSGYILSTERPGGGAGG